jgi:hypothetical protein
MEQGMTVDEISSRVTVTRISHAPAVAKELTIQILASEADL